MKKEENGLLSKISVNDLKEFLLQYSSEKTLYGTRANFDGLKEKFKIEEKVNNNGKKELRVTLNGINKDGGIEIEMSVSISEDYECSAMTTRGNNPIMTTRGSNLEMLDKFLIFLMQHTSYDFVLEYMYHYRQRLNDQAEQTYKSVMKFGNLSACGFCDMVEDTMSLEESIRNQLADSMDSLCKATRKKLDDLHMVAVDTNAFGF